ncbi:MAG TPA: hypothetical protein VN903_17715 [Polyangia bacterium]|nr:hypothetical protein [Polyangia bacterium]
MQETIAPDPNPYTRRFRFPKWNGTITVLQEPRLFRRLPEFSHWTKLQHVQAAQDYLAYATAYLHTGASLVQYGDKTYGTDGPLISGGFRPHWPEPLKDAIRLHLHGATTFHDQSVAHWRAAGRHLSTWRTLRDTVRAEGN